MSMAVPFTGRATAPVLSAGISFGNNLMYGTNPSKKIPPGLWVADRGAGRKGDIFKAACLVHPALLTRR